MQMHMAVKKSHHTGSPHAGGRNRTKLLISVPTTGSLTDWPFFSSLSTFSPTSCCGGCDSLSTLRYASPRLLLAVAGRFHGRAAPRHRSRHAANGLLGRQPAHFATEPNHTATSLTERLPTALLSLVPCPCFCICCGLSLPIGSSWVPSVKLPARCLCLLSKRGNRSRGSFRPGKSRVRSSQVKPSQARAGIPGLGCTARVDVLRASTAAAADLLVLHGHVIICRTAAQRPASSAIETHRPA